MYQYDFPIQFSKFGWQLIVASQKIIALANFIAPFFVCVHFFLDLGQSIASYHLDD